MLKSDDIIIYAFFGIILITIGYSIYSNSDRHLKCIISGIDGEKYCVRDNKKKHLSANLLAKVTGNCKELVIYCAKKYPNNEDIIRLKTNFNETKISETLPNSEYTAYSENKGEKIAFCLHKSKETEKLIDINTLTFVAIHELAHIMTKSEGHKQEFWENFKFLLINAKNAGIYQPEDYKNSPKPYCGMTITDNPYYDL